MTPNDCGRCANWLVDRAYGESSACDRAVLEAHLASCRRCQAVAANVERVARTASLPGDEFARLLSPGALAAIEDLKAREGATLQAASRRWATAIGLALASWWILGSWPVLSRLPAAVSAAHFLAWLGLYGSLLESISSPTAREGGWPVRGRPIAYGVLLAVVLCVVSVGGFLAWDSLINYFWCRHLVAGLSRFVAFLAATSILVVGVFMGLLLGRESPRNMAVVIALFVLVMVPALTHGHPDLVRRGDAAFEVFMIVLWGLAGAQVGSFLSRPSTRTA